jgi:hypothetical protein
LQVVAQRGICRHVLLGAAQERPNCRQNLPEFVVQFARDVPQREFLRRNELLRKIAALRGKFSHLRKEPAIIANQVQAGDYDREQDDREERVKLALHAFINLRDAPSGLLLAFRVMDQ